MRRIDGAFCVLSVALVLLVAMAPSPAAEEPSREPITVARLTLPRVVRHAVLGRGETLSQVLSSIGVKSASIPLWIDAARRQLDLRSLPIGLDVEAVVDYHGTIREVRLTPDWRATVVLEGGDAQVNGRREARPVRREMTVIQGTVESSLFGAIEALGENDTLAVDLADLFQWDVDFHREVRRGDTFQLLVERVVSDGRIVDYGPVVAARYVNDGREITAVRFAGSDGRAGYYDAEGRPLRKQFLRAPLRFSRVTSRFSTSRLHPVLGRRMPHYGVDYGAPTGTPVMATADGTVVFRGWKKGGGNTVEVRHRNGYTTGYLHLSRFAGGLRVGSRVAQGEVVGYVGATGLATGPHLDYRVTRNGGYINPLRLGNDPAPPLPDGELPAFREWAARALPLLALPGTLAEETRTALASVAPVRFDA